MAERATIENFSQAARIVKEMELSSCDGWDGNEWREAGLKAFRLAIEDTMEAYVERSRGGPQNSDSVIRCKATH